MITSEEFFLFGFFLFLNLANIIMLLRRISKQLAEDKKHGE